VRYANDAIFFGELNFLIFILYKVTCLTNIFEFRILLMVKTRSMAEQVDLKKKR